MFQLCLKLGFAHPDYLLAKLDSRQLGDWIAYERNRTIGDEDTIRMLARSIAMIAATGGAKASEAQFLPWHDEPIEPNQKPEDVLRSMPGGAAAAQEIADEIAELEEYKRRQANQSDQANDDP